MVDTVKLKERMRKQGVTQVFAADYLNIAQCTFSLKINNVRPMTLDEAALLAVLLHIRKSEIAEYFFAERGNE